MKENETTIDHIYKAKQVFGNFTTVLVSKCHSCGATLYSDSEKYCHSCGKKFIETQKEEN